MTRILVSLVLIGGLAPAAEPGEAALAYLRNLCEGPGTAESASALSGRTTTEKRATIHRRLDRLGHRLRGGEFRVIEEKVEPPLAAVLVARTEKRDHDALQVHAIALLEREDRWQPAPLPASFENTGIRYDPDLSRPAADLETWMRLQQVLALNRLRDERERKFSESIREAVDPARLRDSEPEAAVLAFLDACRQRDVPSALAYLGGLEPSPPEDWKTIVRTVTRQLESRRSRLGPLDDAWDPLLDEDALHTIVMSDGDPQQARILVGHFRPGPQHVDDHAYSSNGFGLVRSPDGLWRLQLSPRLIESGRPADEFLEHLDSPALNPETLSDISRKLLEKHAPQPCPNPESLAARLRDALASGRFENLLILIDTEGADSTGVLRLSSRLWRDFHPGGSSSPLLLATHRAGPEAACLVAPFDNRRPGIRTDLVSRFLMRKNGQGWLLDPALDSPDSAPPEPIAQWIRDLRERSLPDWLTALTGSPGTARIEGPAPDATDARAAVERWLSGARERDPARSLSAAAWLNDESGPDKLLRALAQELADQASPEYLAVHSSEHWCAVSVRDGASDEEEARELMYPVLLTAAGPRVLAEATLYHADTRSRRFLNAAIWQRLEKQLPQELTDELRSLHLIHTERSSQP